MTTRRKPIVWAVRVTFYNEESDVSRFHFIRTRCVRGWTATGRAGRRYAGWRSIEAVPPSDPRYAEWTRAAGPIV
jgi:hypothetical protein